MALLFISDPRFDEQLNVPSVDIFGDERTHKRHSHGRDSILTTLLQHEEVVGPAAPVDIVETAAAYTLHADAPGMGPQDVKVELHDGVLQISGSRKPRHEPKDARGHILLRRERSSFTFSRAFSLPENANPDGITAAMDKGVLVVTVPKRPQDTARPPAPKRIAVAAKL